jgi:hypothetical protein
MWLKGASGGQEDQSYIALPGGDLGSRLRDAGLKPSGQSGSREAPVGDRLRVYAVQPCGLNVTI